VDADADTQALSIVIGAGGSPVAVPSFSPGAGTYATSQTVTITTGTSGASIRYTTNGTTPTSTTGTLYSAPVAIGSSLSLKAIAYKTGMTNSTVTSGTYTINLPSPWLQQDIGAVGVAGSSTHASGTYTVNGSGTDIWSTGDQFQFCYQTMTGDGEIVARVAAIENTDSNAKAGVMIRESLAANSAHALMNITPASGSQFIRRLTTGGSSSYTAGTNVTAPYWVRLVRSGTTITGSISSNGNTWVTVGSASITMASSVKVGLVVLSRNNPTLNTSTFTNVTVVP